MSPLSIGRASAPASGDRGRFRRLAMSGMLAFLGVAVGTPALAQASGPEVLKAEVIYRTLMFITWPAEREAGRVLHLCIAGDSRLGPFLQALAARPIRQFTIEVRRVSRPEQLVGCHVLYVGEPQPAWRSVLERAHVLVLADEAGMLDFGAMVNLQVEDGRIVFDVDLDAARSAGLTVSAKLLRLARFVRHQSTSP